MTDIVERIRLSCTDYDMTPMHDDERPMLGLKVRDVREAADEIERLRAALAESEAERERILATLDRHGFAFDDKGALLKRMPAGGWDYV